MQLVKKSRKSVVGMVVSDKMQKTIVVKVDRRVRDRLYKKYVVHSCRYKVHDEENTAKVGDRVEIVESRPLSREKRWALRRIVRKGASALVLTSGEGVEA
jgi:small subunit ribosomal protein S17